MASELDTLGTAGEPGSVPVSAEIENIADLEVLGKVRVYRDQTTIFDSKPTENELLSLLSVPAAALGAEAVVGVYSSTTARYGLFGELSGDFHRYASGLAVRPLGDAAGARCDFIVVVPPIFAGDYRQDAALRRSIATVLDRKGYYVYLTSLAGQASDSILEIAGRLFVLEIDGAHNNSNGIIVTAALVSVPEGEVVWEDSVLIPGYSLSSRGSSAFVLEQLSPVADNFNRAVSVKLLGSIPSLAKRFNP